MSYINLSRQRQGRLLRLVGLRQRRSQRPAIRFLRKAGIDLMSFTMPMSVQKKDMRQGLRLAWQEFDIKREAFRYVVPCCGQLVVKDVVGGWGEGPMRQPIELFPSQKGRV